jgi:preprotein translocase subunit SecD
MCNNHEVVSNIKFTRGHMKILNYRIIIPLFLLLVAGCGHKKQTELAHQKADPLLKEIAEGTAVKEYNLTKSSIEDVTYSMIPDGTYYIIIKLNKESADEFRVITKTNIGKNLRIIKDGHIIVEAIIKGEIASGNIQRSGLKSGDEVINFIRILLK